ncbi:PBP1A family penicillin-binding protein [Pigmentibacter sp. JX0631]|uniref:penicillin-binding protein 1A n=1 Tax=Pigmentibacter sp. JX0631 TaxID=2976982 RepID=UPI0024686614|nr:PBP1A family penicillin-binding protein [Pigmentibacter sp. JX0631]WGL60461.1 PBP1A family penicillin-binding protein [Pigmentibacter sp. JX0631]
MLKDKLVKLLPLVNFFIKYSKLIVKHYKILIILIFVLLASFSFYEFKKIKRTLPNLEKLYNYEPALPTVIYSQDGVKIAEIFEERRYPVLINEISPFVKNAFIAAEDAEFYNHHGLDWKGFLRAFLHFVTFSNQKQGGSTITQQLAKNVLLTKERTIIRKIKDIIVSNEIENSFPKDKILELYLNTIYLGNGSYGVEAAAQNYFRKNNMKLSLAEAALIAGLTPAPSAYDPNDNFQAAKLRQSYVLERMFKTGMITKNQYDRAVNENLIFYRAESPNNKVAPYFVEEVKKQLINNLEIENLGKSGLTVYTTLNSKIQNATQIAIQNFADAYQSRRSFKGPIKQHGSSFNQHLKEFISSKPKENEEERAIVTFINEEIQAVGIATQKGVGVILEEDIMWALNADINKETGDTDINNVLKVGDEIHVQKLNKKMQSRIVNDKKFMFTLNSYLQYFNNPSKESFARYTLIDTVGIEAAAMVMDSKSGEILAMVGGEHFLVSQFNRATQAERQVGSSVKPLYYSYAIDCGFTPASKIDSPKIDLDGWQPENYGGKESGRTTLMQSLALSYNIPSIFLYHVMGPSKVTKHLTRFGFNWPLSDLSVALGAGTASLLKMVQAYSIFPNSGKMTLGFYINEVVDRNGEVIYSAKNEKIFPLKIEPQFPEDAPFLPGKTVEKENEIDKLQMISPQAAYVTLDLLRTAVHIGTGQGVLGLGNYVGGKTGTTNANTDAWFLGIASQLVGGVWIGYDDNSKTLGTGGTGSAMAAPIWKTMMQGAIKNYSLKNWTRPTGIHEIAIDKNTGERSTGSDAIGVFIIDGTETGGSYFKEALDDGSNPINSQQEVSNQSFDKSKHN